MTGNISVYAKWTKIGGDTPDPVVEYVYVSFVIDGKTVSSLKIEKNTKVPADDVPATEKEGHTFLGWFTAADEKFDVENANVTESITLTAKYEAILYTVNFITDGGSAVPDQKVAYGDKVAVPETPTKARDDENMRWVFAGWYNGNDLYDFNEEVKGELTLTAHWEAKTVEGGEEPGPVVEYVTVTFVNGEEITTQIVIKGEKAKEPAAPEKDGYKFEGWFAEGATSEFDFANTAINADATYYVTLMVDGAVYDTISVKESVGKVTIPAADEKTGYRFDGWYLDGTKVAEGAVINVTGDITLEGSYVAIQYYAVTFHTGPPCRWHDDARRLYLRRLV